MGSVRGKSVKLQKLEIKEAEPVTSEGWAEWTQRWSHVASGGKGFRL